MQAVSDEQLIRWVAAGDASCLGALFERHHQGVYRYCLQISRNQTLSEDLVQDIFLKVLDRAGSFRGDGSFRGWLFNIARNQTMDALRKAGRQATEPLSAELLEQSLTDERSAERSAESGQRLQLLIEALASLPVAVQEVIWLGRFEFDNFAELGQALDCKAATARVRMHRAMKDLHAALNP